MNKKYQELAAIADYIAGILTASGATEQQITERFREVYAELIVLECFKVLENYALEQVTEPETYLGESLKVGMTINDAADRVKQHFGIE